MSKAEAPSTLSAAGKAFWVEIVAKYDLRPDELRTLEDACAATDMIAELTADWDEMGRPKMGKGSMGQPVPHPLPEMIDKQRKARQAFIRQLNLPDEVSPSVGTNPARAAATTRWKHGA